MCVHYCTSALISPIPFISFTCRGEVTEMKDEDGSLLEKAVHGAVQECRECRYMAVQ
jgi:hypothetical protein